MFRQFISLTIFVGSTAAAFAQNPAPGHGDEGDTSHAPPRIQWEKIAELPPLRGQAKNPGLAGVFAGAQEEVLIIAGGTNYPQGVPWKGGKRAAWRDIYVLERKDSPTSAPSFTWTDALLELPEAVGYGASVSLPDGVLCIGGATLSTVRDTCFLLSWNKIARKVEMTEFPKLPKPLACHAAVLIKNKVYVIGGTSDIAMREATQNFFVLDLNQRGAAAGFVWKSQQAWDGAARIFPVAAASLEDDEESILLCGGRNPGSDPDFLIDLHRFNPVKNDWAILGDVVDRQGHPGHVMATPAFHVPPHHFVVVGGMDETIIRLLENNGREVKELDTNQRSERKKYENLMLENYPGYPRTVLGYDAGIGEWNHIGNFPAAVPLTNPAINWDSQIIIPGGEIAPGKRTPVIWAATVRKKPSVVEEEEVKPEPSSADSVEPPPSVAEAPPAPAPKIPTAGLTPREP